MNCGTFKVIYIIHRKRYYIFFAFVAVLWYHNNGNLKICIKPHGVVAKINNAVYLMAPKKKQFTPCWAPVNTFSSKWFHTAADLVSAHIKYRYTSKQNTHLTYPAIQHWTNHTWALNVSERQLCQSQTTDPLDDDKWMEWIRAARDLSRACSTSWPVLSTGVS